LDSNFEALADRRKRVTVSRKQLDTYKAEIAELTNNKVYQESHSCQDFARTYNILQKYAMPVAEMLEITTKILKDNQKNSKLTNEDYEQVMQLLLDEIQAVKSRISGSCYFAIVVSIW
jgi:transcription initiation factor IIF auxiliary subunit